MASARPSLSISLPLTTIFPYVDNQLPKTPEPHNHEAQLAVEPPPPPRPHAFKVKRKRPSAPLQDPIMLDTTVIPTIEMSEVPTHISSPSLQPRSDHLLSPLPVSPAFSRRLTPPRTPASKMYTLFSQLESPAQEWDLINNTKPTFQRAGSECSSFSDSSVSSCGSSAFSAPTGGYDSPDSEAADPFIEHETTKRQQQDKLLTSPVFDSDAAPQSKRVKTRRDVKWTADMDDHLWMTFMAYLADPTFTPFKMLPGSTPPMGVCDQVASKAKRTWRSRKVVPTLGALLDTEDAYWGERQSEGSADTIRPRSVQSVQPRWPRVAPTRRRLRELCAKRPSISAHYARMLRTRSPSPFETSSECSQPAASSFMSHEMHKTLITSTAPSMQPDNMLAQLASDQPPPAPKAARPARPEGWFDRIPRSKAHQKSASLQSELRIHVRDMDSKPEALASPFNGDSRTHLLRSMANTKSLGRTEFNGRSLDSPFDYQVGAPTDRRSRKRRFRSDEEKPRRPILTDDVFGPPVEQPIGTRNRGFSLGAAHIADPFAKLFSPPSSSRDLPMPDALHANEDIPMGSRSAPRRLLEPIPRLGSPFIEAPLPSRQQHNTFPRASLLPSAQDQEPFHQRLLQLQQVAVDRASRRVFP